RSPPERSLRLPAALLRGNLVEPDDLSGREHVLARHELELRVRGALVEAIELGDVERVHDEVVVVDAVTGRRTRAVVLTQPEVVGAVHRADSGALVAPGVL